MATSAGCRVNYRQRSGSKETTPLAVSLFAYPAYPPTPLGRPAQKDTDDPPTSGARRVAKGASHEIVENYHAKNIQAILNYYPQAFPIEIQLF